MNPAENPGKALRVLLVDDSENEAQIVIQSLKAFPIQPYEIDWVQTFDEALETIAKRCHDIYLIDYGLGPGGGNGLELLHQAEEKYGSIPSILLTSDHKYNVDIRAMRLGVADYLVKSEMNANQLDRSIRYALVNFSLVTEMQEHLHRQKLYIATLTHDLRTPIRGEHRVLELLLSGYYDEKPEERKAIYMELLKSNQFLSSMVDNLLSAYKYEQSEKELRVEKTSISQVLQETCNELSLLAADKSIEIVLEIDESIPRLWVDPLELKRMIMNLAQNAIKFSPRGKSVLLRWFRQADCYCLQVIDEGPGIPEEKREEIFKPYASMAKRFREVGTGLGLFLAKTIVELHGGDISVNCPETGGTIMTISLSESLTDTPWNVDQAPVEAAASN